MPTYFFEIKQSIEFNGKKPLFATGSLNELIGPYRFYVHYYGEGGEIYNKPCITNSGNFYYDYTDKKNPYKKYTSKKVINHFHRNVLLP